MTAHSSESADCVGSTVADKYSAPKGTVDLVGSSAFAWEHLTQVAQRVFGQYGYAPIYTPIFENTEVFTRGIGEATDVVGKEMYTFLDKGERSITLRPENTAAVVRAAIEGSLTANGATAKLYYAGPMFRYERPQKGRQRQFYQVGAEALGFDSPEADAEMIIMLWRYFTELGFPSTAMRLLLNSMGDPACRPAYRDSVANYIRAHADRLCEECNRRADTNPLRAFDCKNPGCRATMADAPKIHEALCPACGTHHNRVRELLDLAGIPYVLDPSLVRGLDYYTRTVFEVQVDTGLGSQNAIGGGGRYDGLFESLGGKPTPGIGFAVGFERIVLALEALGVTFPDRSKADVFVAYADGALKTEAFTLVTSLRDAGVRAALDLTDRPLKSQIRQADRLGVAHAIILGPDEFAAGNAVLRDMAQGLERHVSIASLVAELS